MIISSEVQKKMEARLAVFGVAFLAGLKCVYVGKVDDLHLFLDLKSEHLIGIEADQLCKERLINNLNLVRGQLA